MHKNMDSQFSFAGLMNEQSTAYEAGYDLGENYNCSGRRGGEDEPEDNDEERSSKRLQWTEEDNLRLVIICFVLAICILICSLHFIIMEFIKSCR